MIFLNTGGSLAVFEAAGGGSSTRAGGRAGGPPWGLSTLRCKDFLQGKQSYRLPVHFTLFVSIRFVSSPFEPEGTMCIFCLYNRVAEELYFLVCFLSWRPEGPPVGCLARGLARSRLAQAFDGWTRVRFAGGEGFRGGQLSLGLGSGHLETEESEWSACFNLPKARRDSKQTFHSGHTWRERTPASLVCWVLS